MSSPSIPNPLRGTPSNQFSGSTSHASATDFAPLRYGSYQDRKAKLTKLSPEEVYFPSCTATTYYAQGCHFLKMYTQGIFLQTYDAHLNQANPNSDVTTFSSRRIAEARAAINITGKVILGISLVGACVGTITCGLIGIIGGAGLFVATKGEFDPAAGAYIGALVGCAVAGSICCAGAFIGSSLIALTESDLTCKERLMTVAGGTGLAFLIALHSASPVINVGSTVSQINYLQEGNIKGFLFLHCLGLPT